MIIERTHNGIRYTLSNDNLKVSDEVYPIARGRITDNNEFILEELDYRDFMSGFPDEPHIIEDLYYSLQKSYEVKTSHGYSPIECYYKIIKKEKRVIEHKNIGVIRITTRDEWVEMIDEVKEEISKICGIPKQK